jgi:N-glycosylase/DNA lyase
MAHRTPEIAPGSPADLRDAYAARKEEIQNRLADFRNIIPQDYFYEIVYCLLTPQSRARNAERVVSLLQEKDFEHQEFHPVSLLRNPEHYIRFHATKANHLLRLKEQYPEIMKLLTSDSESFEKREWLVQHVAGLGYKESTHLLRNIGKNGGLAILDRHILRNLKRYQAIKEIPPTLSRSTYLKTEHAFLAFSERIGIPLDALDLLFWSFETGEILK